MHSKSNCALIALLICVLAGVLGAQTADPDSQASAAPADSSASEGFHWKPALLESGFFLVLQHSGRMVQAKTRRELGGEFFEEWFSARPTFIPGTTAMPF